jgi:electron transport complex protein RnfB
MLIEILKAALVIGALGLISGAILAFASKVFYIKKDEKVSIISDYLPCANCGACGYTSCLSYAEAIVEKSEKTSLCTVGGESVKQSIEGVIDTEA